MRYPRVSWSLALLVLGTLGGSLACNLLDQTVYRNLPPTAGPPRASGHIWADDNRNGVYDSEEKNLNGVRVYLRDETGNLVAQTTSGLNGDYSIDMSKDKPGTYLVGVDRPDGMAFTINGGDSDILPASGESRPFAFDGEGSYSINAGLITFVSGPTSPAPTAIQEGVATMPAATATEANNNPKFTATYRHTVPGQYSEIVITFDGLAEGQKVSGVVTGPSVDGDGSFSATGGADGTAEATVKIFSYGDYTVEVQGFNDKQLVRVVAGTPTPSKS